MRPCFAETRHYSQQTPKNATCLGLPNYSLFINNFIQHFFFFFSGDLSNNCSEQKVFPLSSVHNCQRTPVVSRMVEAVELNEDIYGSILSRLPAKSLLQYKLVSKPFESIISNLHFVSQQAQRSCESNTEFFALIYAKSSTSFLWNTAEAGINNSLQQFLNQKGLELVCSCNGVLCCWKYGGLYSTIMILNPINMDFFTLPSPIRGTDYHDILDRSTVETSVGVAFDPSVCFTNFNYKVVLVEALISRFETSYESCHDIKFQVFSSETGQWNMSKETNSCYTISDKSPVFHEGILFWLCVREHILAFDAKNEKSWLVNFPSSNSEEKRDANPHFDDEWLGSLEGGLCFLQTSITKMNIWTTGICNSESKWLLKYCVCLQTVVDNNLDLFGSTASRPPYRNLKINNFKLSEMDVKVFHPLYLCGDGRVFMQSGDGILCYDVITKRLSELCSVPNMNFVYFYPKNSSLIYMKLFKKKGE